MIIQKLINSFHRIIEIQNWIMYNMHIISFVRSNIIGVNQRIGDEKMDIMKGTITRRLDNSLNALQNEFGELICDRDFKRSLQALKQASRSERPTRLRNLYLLFDKCEIIYERGRDNNYYENDPSGQGINYKNFAEMVYLYYISKPLEPQQKIKASAEMINEIIIRSQKREEVNELEDNDTFAYHYLFSEDILNLPEEKFRRYLILNYRCLPEEGNNSVVPIQLQTRQKSAFLTYQSLKTGLVSLLHKKGITIEDCNYGLWFTDASYLLKKVSVQA